MCKQPLHVPWVPILLLALGVGNTLALRQFGTPPRNNSVFASSTSSNYQEALWAGNWLLTQREMTVVVAMLSWLWYSTYVIAVIRQICEFLGVQVLSISKVLARNAAFPAAAAAEAKDVLQAYHDAAVEGKHGSRAGGSEVDALSAYSSSSHSGSDKEE
jgi:hypothetical protein